MERLAKMFASLRIAGYLASSPSSAAEEIGVRIVAGVHIAFSGMRHSSAAAAVRGGAAVAAAEVGVRRRGRRRCASKVRR